MSNPVTGGGVAVGKLQIPISALAGQGVAVDTVVSGEDLAGDLAKDLRVGPVTVQGVLSEAGHEYVFRGSVSGSFARICDRCLYEVTLPFASAVDWVFSRSVPQDPVEEVESEDAEGVAFPIEGPDIDLAGPAWEEVVLAYPQKFVACEDRPDLCPECHEDERQKALIAGQDDEAEQRFKNEGLAALRDMFPELQRPDEEE